MQSHFWKVVFGTKYEKLRGVCEDFNLELFQDRILILFDVMQNCIFFVLQKKLTLRLDALKSNNLRKCYFFTFEKKLGLAIDLY